jgi:hypothetical protein
MPKSKLPNLSIPNTAPDLVRGPGYQFSTEQPAPPAALPPAATPPLAAHEDEQPKKKPSVPPGFTKIGWAVREEYKKKLKVLAAEGDRDAYELLDEAIRNYLAQHSR